MNELNLIENMMIDLKDSQITNDNKRMQETSEKIVAYLIQLRAQKNITKEVMIMSTRLEYLHGKFVANIQKG